MNTTKRILNNMINELPDDLIPEVITYISFIQNTRKNLSFIDIEEASASSMDFWNNQIDDEVWNNV